MSQIDQSFELARSLPLQVSMSQIEAMIVGFPIPAPNPVWKTTTMKVATAGAIGSTVLLSYWLTNDAEPLPELKPQIQVPIEADTTKTEAALLPIKEPKTLQTAAPEAAEVGERIEPKTALIPELVQSLLTVKPVLVTDTDTIAAINPIPDIPELFPRSEGGLFNVADIDTLDLPETELGLFEDEDDENCACNCSSTDVVEWNKHIDTGIMSFQFSCDNDDIYLDRQDLKRFSRQLTRELKRANLYEKEVRIDFLKPNVLILNEEKLKGEVLETFLILLDDYDIESGKNRKILLAKDQIWVGDFEQGEFTGSAQGFNVKKSMADEWLED
jgi:hypothetical protein